VTPRQADDRSSPAEEAINQTAVGPTDDVQES
jgi:hypothetical protein